MIIRRGTRPRRFTIVDLALMNDTRLSAEALGVLIYLLSKPDDWTVSVEQLKRRFAVGRDKMQSIMRLLRDCGYARLEEIKDGGTGRLIGRGYMIHDEAVAVPANAAEEHVVPAIPDGATDCARQPEKPAVGGEPTEHRLSRLTESPTVGKPGHIDNTEPEPKTEREPTPKAPANAGGGVGLSLWDRFEEGWVWDLLESREPAKRAFEQLDAVDQTHAARYARKFCEIAAQRQRRKVNASKWLRDRGWQNLAQQATTGTLPPSKAVIWAGTPQAAAWLRHHGKAKLFMFEMKRPDGSRALGRLEDTEWPPNKSPAPSPSPQPELRP